MLLLILLFFASILFNAAWAASPSYVRTNDGIIIFTDPVYTGTSIAVKLEVVSDNIIRVIAAPGKELPATQSLITVYNKNPGLTWNIITDDDKLSLITK